MQAKNIDLEKFGKFISLPKTPKKLVLAVMNAPRDAEGRLIPTKSFTIPDAVPLGEFVTTIANSKGASQIVKIPKPFPSYEQQESKLNLHHLEDQYFVGSNGYYFLSTSGNPIRFTNFILQIVMREEIITRKGSKLQFVIRIQQGDKQISFTIAEQSYKSLDRALEKKHPYCHIYTDNDGRAREYFKRILSILLEQENFPSKKIHAFWGWGDASPDGTRIFYEGGRPDCSGEKCLPQIRNVEEKQFFLRKAWKIFEVGPKSVMYPLFVYSAASYLDTIFTDAGHPLAHCMMAIAKSGSLKTSLFKEIYAPFVPKEKRLFTVRSTSASINFMPEIAWVDTLVIDDYNREGSMKEISAKTKNLCDLIRLYSDKTPRAKYGGNDNIKQYAVCGGCVFTCEGAMSGEIQSASVRHIKIIFPGKLNGEKLKIIQDDPMVMPIFFGELIRFLERHYTELVSKTKMMFNIGRSKYQEIEFSRLKDALIHMCITADIIGDFMVENQALAPELASSWKTDFEMIMRNIILQQDRNAAPLETHFLYIQAIWDLLGTGKVQLAPSPESYQNAPAHYIGYVDGRLYMLEKTETYRAVCNYYESRREYFPASADELSKLLKERGLTKCDSTGCLKRASAKVLGRPRMLALQKDLCEKLLNQED